MNYESRIMAQAVFVEQGTRSRLPVQYTSSREGAILGRWGAILGGKQLWLGRK